MKKTIRMISHCMCMEKKGSIEIQILDDWNNAYHHVKEEKLVGYTWQGTHIFKQGKHPPTEPLKPMPSMDFFTARPWEADYNAFTSRYMEPLHTSFGDMHMRPPRPMGDGYYGEFEPKIEPTFPYPKAKPTYSYPRDDSNISIWGCKISIRR